MQELKKNRNTLQRRIVLETVQNMTNHPDADTVYEKISKEHPLVSKATVYRNLKILAKQGLILHIPMLDGADCFDFNCLPHYHIKCRKCGGVFDVDLPYQKDICSKINRKRGFIIESHQIVFSGVCPDCQ
ncbi:MAG: transcriptional repressor [Ruminococcus sp.]|nr:transcriptional repressor [Ruminococcus sp.]